MVASGRYDRISLLWNTISFDCSRNLKKKSTETFVVPTSLNIGKLIKIKVRQTFSSWILQWRLQKVTVSPGWKGAQSGRSTQM